MISLAEDPDWSKLSNTHPLPMDMMMRTLKPSISPSRLRDPAARTYTKSRSSVTKFPKLNLGDTMWETLDKMERNEKSGSGERIIHVKSVERSEEKVERVEIVDHQKTVNKVIRSPVNAWPVGSDFKKEFEGELGLKNGVPLVPLYTRLKLFYVIFLMFGVDISGSKSKGKKCCLFFFRAVTLIVYFVLAVAYWAQTFMAIKYKYIEYGAALLHLVISAALTSVVITHCIANSRLDKLMRMMDKLDSINAALPLTFGDNKVAITSFFSSLFFIVGYVIFPLKWAPGEGLHRNETMVDRRVPYVNLWALGVHQQVNILTVNNISVGVAAVGMMWDMVYLSFFIIIAKRYYNVFRNSYFVLMLSRPNKCDTNVIMQEFRKHHFSICGVVEEMDEIFSPMILLWYTVMTIAMCCWIRAFDTAAFNSMITGIVILGSLAVSFIQFYSLSHGTSLINDEMNAHLDTVRSLCIKEDSPSKSSMENFQERISHLSYITCILTSPVAITGWGFFCVSKGFVLTVCSTVLTFTLVLYGV